MASTSLGGLQFYGWLPSDTTGRNDYTLDASGEKLGLIFRVPKTGNIDRVSFRVQAVTSSETLRVGLETLDGSGDPSTTQYGGSAVGTQTSPAALTSYEVTLATPASATIGDYVAAVIQFDSSVGNLSLSAGSTNLFPNSMYTDHYTTAWAKSGRQLQLSIRYDDALYYPVGAIPPVVLGSAAINTGTNPDEVAAKIELPVAVQACGMYCYVDQDNAMDMVLYDSGGTALETVSASTVARASAGVGWTLFPFAPRELSVGNYYVTIKPTSGSSVTVYYADTLAQGHWGGMSGGTMIYYTARENAGAWSDTVTRRLFAGLVVAGTVNATGGGGRATRVIGG